MATTKIDLDILMSLTPLGYRRAAHSDNIYGINHRDKLAALNPERMQRGLVFFVKPQLNLSLGNLRRCPELYALDTSITSAEQAVCATLDPRRHNIVGDKYITPYKCALVDPLNAFIPMLTNGLLKMDALPDEVLPTYATKAGAYGQQYIQPDGILNEYGAFDLSATFRNTEGSLELKLFRYWLLYMDGIVKNTCVPYDDFVIGNELESNTRFYMLKMDMGGRFVKMLGSVVVAIPVSVPMGDKFSFDINEDLVNISEFDVKFKCVGAEYNKPILFYEFNKTVWAFNPLMRDEYRSGCMTKIPFNHLAAFKNRGYPRINYVDNDNPSNTENELEWWVPNEVYTERMDAIRRSGLIDMLGG